MPTPPPRVLLVEDEEAIRDLVSFHLKLADFDYTTLADGNDALDLAQQRQFDSDHSGHRASRAWMASRSVRSIRREGPNREVPILMLTARAEEADRVMGLESGADDYLTSRSACANCSRGSKRSCAGRRAPGAAPRTDPNETSCHTSVSTIDPTRRRVTVDGRVVALTPHEFSLLHLLSSHPGTCSNVTRSWPGSGTMTCSSPLRGVDALVKRLRRKIEDDPAQPKRVLTAWGTGYKFGED